MQERLRVGLERITPPDARHTLMIAASVSAGALSTSMGHANISITLPRFTRTATGT